MSAWAPSLQSFRPATVCDSTTAQSLVTPSPVLAATCARSGRSRPSAESAASDASTDVAADADTAPAETVALPTALDLAGADAFVGDARYPRRARTSTPFRFTRTVSLWNFPSGFCVE